ncbi:MAG: LURP-one-related family protein [Firmicutes bacterium]|nr:LURP-one-related family protein [Bacillota bacterium]
MKYAIKQKIFTFGDSFAIRDETGNDCYMVKGQIFALGNKLRIYDMQGQELVYIEQKLFRFLPEYNIYYKDQLHATVKKEFTFFKPKFQIQSTLGNYRAEGNVWSMDFSILRDEKLVAQISKAWFAWSDTYGVDIAEGEDAPLMLALVIVIDQVLHQNKNNT